MEFTSEVKEESSSSRPWMLQFKATFVSSNPVGLLEDVFVFLSENSDIMKKPSLAKEIAAALKVSKEKMLEIPTMKEKKKETETGPIGKDCPVCISPTRNYSDDHKEFQLRPSLDTREYGVVITWDFENTPVLKTDDMRLFMIIFSASGTGTPSLVKQVLQLRKMYNIMICDIPPRNEDYIQKPFYLQHNQYQIDVSHTPLPDSSPLAFFPDVVYARNGDNDVGSLISRPQFPLPQPEELKVNRKRDLDNLDRVYDSSFYHIHIQTYCIAPRKQNRQTS